MPIKRSLSKLDIGLLFVAGFLLAISVYYFVTLIGGRESYTTTSTAQLNTLPTSSAADTSANKEVIGFLPSWMLAKKAKVYPEKLTQIIYFGLGVTEDGDIIKYKEDNTPVLEWTYLNANEFSKVRQEAEKHKVKILVALKNFDNSKIDKLVGSRTATSRFTQQVAALVDEHNLDGVNIDFEYVTKTDFPTARYFNRFLETLTTELKAKNPNLIVSVDINATGVIKDPAYDLVKIGELADQVILMGYDFHRTGSYNAGPVAPIAAGILEHSITKAYNSLKGRIPEEKVILGLPFYGYEWQTVNTNYKSITVANTGALATWGRVHDLIKSRDDVQINWEEKAQSPWLIYRQSGAIKQIYYENEKSLAAKLDFVKKNKLSGIAIWALGYEGNYTEPWEVIEKHL